MADKKRKYDAEVLPGKPLKLQKRPRHEDENGNCERNPSAEKLVLPESRDLVLRLIDKIKQH